MKILLRNTNYIDFSYSINSGLDHTNNSWNIKILLLVLIDKEFCQDMWPGLTLDSTPYTIFKAVTLNRHNICNKTILLTDGIISLT